MNHMAKAENKPLPEAWERLLVQGELQHLNAEQRSNYYLKVCDSLGLNPLTKPFEYIMLNGRLTLYAKKDCTDQLRSIRKISIKITSREVVSDLYIVTAQATDHTGRCDESIGAVSIKNLSGTDKANALMKCESKAKRRVTLSICGLGFLDESEAEDVSTAATHEATPVRTALPEYLPGITPPCTAETFVANLRGVSGAADIIKATVERLAASSETAHHALKITQLVGAELHHSDVDEAELFPFEKKEKKDA